MNATLLGLFCGILTRCQKAGCQVMAAQCGNPGGCNELLSCNPANGEQHAVIIWARPLLSGGWVSQNERIDLLSKDGDRHVRMINTCGESERGLHSAAQLDNAPLQELLAKLFAAV